MMRTASLTGRRVGMSPTLVPRVLFVGDCKTLALDTVREQGCHRRSHDTMRNFFEKLDPMNGWLRVLIVLACGTSA